MIQIKERKKYDTDLTNSQWKIIKPLFWNPGNKSKWEKRELIHAVLYLIDSGCKWRQLPHDFTPYTTKKYPTIKASCGDEGYQGTFKNFIEKIYKIRIDISKRIKPKFEILPKRWRVERTFSWMSHSCRLSKDYEITTTSSASMVKISHIHTLLRRL
jgi:putative transposase